MALIPLDRDVITIKYVALAKTYDPGVIWQLDTSGTISPSSLIELDFSSDPNPAVLTSQSALPHSFYAGNTSPSPEFPNRIPLRNFDLVHLSLELIPVVLDLIEQNQDHLLDFTELQHLSRIERQDRLLARLSLQRLGLYHTYLLERHNGRTVDHSFIIGMTTLITKTDQHREIGYWLDKNYTGKGLMTTAVQALTELSFSPLSPLTQQVSIVTDINNVDSAAIACRLHFTPTKQVRYSASNPAQSGRAQVWVKTRP